MASTAQVAANRENALKAGVRTPEGKAISRLNARRHGIFAAALTPEDSEELGVIEEDLVADLQPAGRVEEMLVETLAMTYLRMQRCARAEAEYHVATWEEPAREDHPLAWEELRKRRKRGERAVVFREEKFKRMVELIGLYNARLTNQFLKTLHEIERCRRLRQGENVPPPVVADVTIQADAEEEPEAEPASPAPPQAPEPEKPQEAAGQGDNAKKRFEKTNPISGEKSAETASVIPSKEGIQNSSAAGKTSVGEQPARRSLGFLPSRE
ncbi:MAG: hypothetical protein ACLQVA_02075 [Candidatus Brocadiia bacterium]